jgi:hypothetical protein
MGLLEIIVQSLGKSIKPKRFLPFFAAYLVFSFAILGMLWGVLNIMPNIIIGDFTSGQMNIFLIMLTGIAVLLFAAAGVNIWLSGALVFSLFKKKHFSDSIAISKRFFWRFVILGLLIALIYILSTVLGDFSILVSVLIGWIFMFSMVSIIVKDDGVSRSLRRSYEMVKTKAVNTFVFFLVATSVYFLILFAGIIASDFTMYNLIMDLNQAFPNLGKADLTPADSVSMIGIITANYPYLFITSVVGSLFASIATVFMNASRTFYFLSFKKR